MLRYFASKVFVTSAAATLVVGFVPILILSLLTDSFWPRSRVAVPLSLVPSVLIGDSFILPAFNGVAALALAAGALRNLPERNKLKLYLLAMGSMALSAAVNVYLHLLWMRNGQTGFIALTSGQLSLAGKWHLVFASLQMAFILWFLFVSLTLTPSPERLADSPVPLAWGIFAAYSALALGDFVVWHVVVARSFKFHLADSFALVNLPLALAVRWHTARVWQFQPERTGKI